MQAVLFISGVGLLLLAMQRLESALAGLGSAQLTLGLQSFTKTPLHGVILGLIATAILQSSSIVALMTMAFVGAGIMPLKSAIGVILGSNLGTTFTGWIVTFLGFEMNLTELYTPLMGLGAVGIVFLKQESKVSGYAQFLFAFGLLLLGLALMKDSIVFIVDYVDVAKIQDYPVFFYFIFGAGLTALIQSSSVTMVIALTAMSAGILEISSAAALVIGADLGTTSTVIIGAIKSSIIKRQVALVHFIFNLTTDITALLCLPLLLLLVTNIFTISNPLYQLVAMHSTINLAGLVLFFPFIKKLQKFVETRIPESEQEALFVSKVSNEIPTAALQAIEKDIVNLIQAVIALNSRRLGVHVNNNDKSQKVAQASIESTYSELKHQENELSDYILDFQRQALSVEQSERTHQLLVCIRDTVYASKAVKDIQHDIEQFRRHPDPKVKIMLDNLLKNTTNIYQAILDGINGLETFPISELGTLIEMVRSAHTACNSSIYELIDNNVLKKESASTALNINREVLLSVHSLVNAFENFLLPSEQAKTVSELLNMKS
ncbi:Na/Pi symporter [Gammaproteobacteria bacterium]|nr:Na/Pi symporter [Gammaproteobacteria bacterium]